MSRALEIAAITGVAIAIWVLYLYRKKRLKEDHAILWLGVSVAVVLVATWSDLLLALKLAVGADNPTDVVFSAFLLFLLVVSIYYSMKISELTEQNRKLAQEVALLKTPATSTSSKEDSDKDESKPIK